MRLWLIYQMEILVKNFHGAADKPCHALASCPDVLHGLLAKIGGVSQNAIRLAIHAPCTVCKEALCLHSLHQSLKPEPLASKKKGGKFIKGLN